MLKRSRRPLLARLLNFGDRVLRAVHIPRDTLTPESAKADAAQVTRLSDFGLDDFEEGLRVLCHSVENDAKLDLIGRGIVRSYVRRVLSNRLELVDYRKKHPETFETELVPPVIVVGLPRTGTTYLHRLLAQAPDAYGPPTWQVWRPLPRSSGPDRRREITIRALDGLRKVAPDLDRKHYQDAAEPEECYHLLDPSFRALGLSMLCPAFGYVAWSMQQDLRPAYRIYREYLQIIQAEVPGRRLTLKSPLHTPYLGEILTEIPGARFVQTHRDPVEAAGSLASLLLSMHSITSPSLDPKRAGEAAVDLLSWMAARTLEQRRHAGLPVVDVQYSDLAQDPVGTVRTIHEAYDLAWSPEIEKAVSAGVARRPQHKQGAHRYTLSDFGLTESQIRDAVELYSAQFLGASSGLSEHSTRARPGSRTPRRG